MAIQILENIAHHSVPGYQLVNHETKHDLESLVWVTYYALYRKAWYKAENSDQRKVIEGSFKDDFGLVPARQIVAKRYSITVAGFRAVPEMHQYFHPDDMRVVGDLLRLVEAQNRYVNPEDIGATGQELNAMTCIKVKKCLDDSLQSIQARRGAIK